jgi:lipopolysaccharide/colanic/teichoic acid biosynthesis glycosyltransferase
VKRFFDIFFSLLLVIFLSPMLLLLALLIVLTSAGGAIYKQERIGRGGTPFRIFKFRTMRIRQVEGTQITVGSRDPRITGVGYYLRKLKLDELPQLFNILSGQMSFVGPRPEVARYVKHYSEEQRKVLDVRPGLTDLASLEYFEESDLLQKAEDPEQEYIQIIMPAKLELSKKYLEDKDPVKDLKIIIRTATRILFGSRSK